MIYLTKGQPLFDNSSMVVYDPSGYYEDGASVVCAASYAPEEPVCRYEVKYIAYGNMVYTISEPEKLMEKILEIDPKSLFGKTNQDVTLDKVVEKIQTVEPTDPAPNTPSTDSQTTPEPTPVPPIEEVITTPEQVEQLIEQSTTTPIVEPSIISTPLSDPATTDVVIEHIIPTNPQSEMITPLVENISTTTPPLTEITF